MTSNDLSYLEKKGVQPINHRAQKKVIYHFKRLVLSRAISENILLILIQYLSVIFEMTNNSLPLSFSVGTACGFIFLRGNRILPGVWFGTYFGYLALIQASIAFTFASVLTAQTYFLFKLSQQLNISIPIFFRKKYYFHFLLLSVFLATLSSIIHYFFSLDPSYYLTFIFRKTLINLNGILIISTAIVTWDYYYPEWHTHIFSSLLKFSWLILLIIYAAFFLTKNMSPAINLLVIFSFFLVALRVSKLFKWPGAIMINTLFALSLSLTIFLNDPQLGPNLLLIEALFIMSISSCLITFDHHLLFSNQTA